MPHREEARHALVARGVIGGPAVRLREALREAHDLHRERRRQPALPQIEHAIERAALVEPEQWTSRIVRRERELHLVPVGPCRRRGHDGAHGRLGDAAQMAEHLAHLALLEEELRLVRQLLEPAAAAALHVHAARRHAGGRWRLDRGEPRFGEAPAGLGHARADTIAGQPTVHEDHAALDPGERLAAQGDVLHVEG